MVAAAMEYGLTPYMFSPGIDPGISTMGGFSDTTTLGVLLKYIRDIEIYI